MDNSATSFPKPETVTEAMTRFAVDCGASAGRGAYAEARACGDLLAMCRERIARLLHAEGPERIVFTLNCSHGLNIVIHGILNTAGAAHAIATTLDHNSVLRPYNALAAQTGLQPEFIPCDPRTGLVDPEDVRRAIRPETRLIAIVHASNVTGTVQPVGEIAAVARDAGVPCLVDAAQSAGHIPIDVQAWGADFVAMPGHKGLLGPLGTGALYVCPGAESLLGTMHEGGTGTISETVTHPTAMPDKFEVGSHNAIGLAGLAEAVRYLLDRTVEDIHAHARANTRRFLASCEPIDGLTVYGPGLTDPPACRTDVFSVRVDDYEANDLAAALEARYGILTRPGIHCAPLAHRTIGTHPGGTTRLSFGPFTTADEVDAVATALADLATEEHP